MKVLIVSQHFWPEKFTINDVALELKNRGHEVHILTGKPNYPRGNFFRGYSFLRPYKEYWNGIKILRLPIIPRGNASGTRLFFNYVSFILSGLFLSPIVFRKARYEVIFVYGTSPIFQAVPALFLGALFKIPVVLWVQDLWPDSLSATGYVKSAMLLKLVKFFVKLVYNQVDLILVQSRAFVEPILKIAPKKRILYFPNSVGKYFYNAQSHSVPNIQALNSGFNLLFAGNIGVAQSMETIASAASRLKNYPKIKIIIFGAGSRLLWMEEEIRARGLRNVVLGGEHPMEAMPHLMRKASALLVTLTGDPIFSLTVPNKIQAYLAVGKPIIACLNGEGARLILEANAGLTVNAEDSIGLANAIIEMYKMTEIQRNQFGENGKFFFKNNFDENILTDCLIAHFEELAGKE
jgi:glycosyltransferase involved in cell wall biosynthesis